MIRFRNLLNEGLSGAVAPSSFSVTILPRVGPAPVPCHLSLLGVGSRQVRKALLDTKGGGHTCKKHELQHGGSAEPAGFGRMCSRQHCPDFVSSFFPLFRLNLVFLVGSRHGVTLGGERTRAEQANGDLSLAVASGTVRSEDLMPRLGDLE